MKYFRVAVIVTIICLGDNFPTAAAPTSRTTRAASGGAAATPYLLPSTHPSYVSISSSNNPEEAILPLNSHLFVAAESAGRVPTDFQSSPLPSSPMEVDFPDFPPSLAVEKRRGRDLAPVQQGGGHQRQNRRRTAAPRRRGRKATTRKRKLEATDGREGEKRDSKKARNDAMVE